MSEHEKKERFLGRILAIEDMKDSHFNVMSLMTKEQFEKFAKENAVTVLYFNIMSKSALVILAKGAEEMETVITVDMLRRAGVTVTMAGLDGSQPVLCSRQITLVPDKSLDDAHFEKPLYDAVILPGGLEGAERLSKSAAVGDILRAHEKEGKILAAICAAPTVFVTHGVAHNKKVTSYPTTKDKIPSEHYTYVEGTRVVVDGQVVTSRGPGTAYWFGLALIEMLQGKDEAAKVEKGMIISCY